MKIEELKKLVDLEVQWLRYYSREDSRMRFNENSDIYTDLVSIGYTKRVVRLDLRCCPCVLTSDELITNNTDVSDLKKAEYNVRGENKLSPVEAYITIFPEKKIEIIGMLKDKNYLKQV